MKASLLAALTIALSVPSALAEGQDYQAAVRFYTAGNYTKAGSIFHHVVLAHPEDANAAYYRALCAQQLRQFDRAKILFKEVAEKFPNDNAGKLSRQALQQLSAPRSRTANQPAARALGGGANDKIEANKDSLPEDVRLPFSKMPGGHLLVRGSVNDRPIDMIFDTGASSCAFGANNLLAAGVPPPTGKPNHMVTGVGGMVPSWDMVADVGFGPIKRSIPISVIGHLDRPLLGQTFFSDYAYDIDTAGGFIRLTRKSKSQANRSTDLYPTDSVAVPFRREGRELVVEAKVNGQPYLMYFDTGASGTVFSFGDIRALGIHVAPEDAQGIVGSGVGGPSVGMQIRIDRIELGPVLKSNLNVMVLSQTAPRPLLGQTFFGDKRFTIDNENNVIRFWH